jgi:urea transporter
VLRGPAQVYFQHAVVTGGLVLAALVVADWRMAVLAVIGAVGGLAGGRLSGFPRSIVPSGMQAFCGTLVGAAVFAALGGAAWWSYLLALAGGVATGPVTRVVERVFTTTALRRYDLPSTTAPFVIVASVIAVATSRLAVAAPDPGPGPVPAFFASLLTNVSQVVLVDDVRAGALILGGLFLAGWRVGVAAVLGSLVGSLAAVVMGQPWTEIADGLTGYSSVLTAIALTATFLRSSAASWLYALPWTAATTAVTLLMHRLGLATYTWPYILVTWAALVVATYVPGLDRPRPPSA